MKALQNNLKVMIRLALRLGGVCLATLYKPKDLVSVCLFHDSKTISLSRPTVTLESEKLSAKKRPWTSSTTQTRRSKTTRGHSNYRRPTSTRRSTPLWVFNYAVNVSGVSLNKRTCVESLLLFRMEIVSCIFYLDEFLAFLFAQKIPYPISWKWTLISFAPQKAEAQLAYELQAAKIQQKIRNEEIQIQVRVKSCDDQSAEHSSLRKVFSSSLGFVSLCKHDLRCSSSLVLLLSPGATFPLSQG